MRLDRNKEGTLSSEVGALSGWQDAKTLRLRIRVLRLEIDETRLGIGETVDCTNLSFYISISHKIYYGTTSRYIWLLSTKNSGLSRAWRSNSQPKMGQLPLGAGPGRLFTVDRFCRHRVSGMAALQNHFSTAMSHAGL